MLHHRTDDPGLRAWDVAEREAAKVWNKTGDYDSWFQTLTTEFNFSLKVFAGEPPLTNS